jgi:hypothetical protein
VYLVSDDDHSETTMNIRARISAKTSHMMNYACFNEIWLLRFRIRGKISQ